jgi:hypothetical protein
MSTDNELDGPEMYRRMVKGRMEASVRGTDDPAKVAKFTTTMAKSGRVSPAAVAELLREVEGEAVTPFAGAPWHQPERRARFETLRAGVRCLKQPGTTERN